ncbi:putative antirestriction protein [Escherichia coli]|uniref:Putative antirestriction protein n=1 Tax=Escherichia coli TaxID=562 RepID=A0A376RIB9_ECOLX|nr:putative antirestriction protein [Escherichia coli]
MKTVSQNTPTIYSATTPENNPPQLVASLVPDEQRISFWPQHFGLIPQWGDPGAPCLRLDGPSVRRLLRWYLESVHPEQRRGIYGTRTG